MIAQAMKQLAQQRAKLQREVNRLDKALGALQKLVGRGKRGRKPGRKPGKKRTMSASARRKIAAFQKARWAKIRAAQK